MCMMLYIGSDNKLPVTKLQEDTESLIFIDDIPEIYDGVRKHFTKKYKYSVYAKVNCGLACGLRFNESDYKFPPDITDTVVIEMISENDRLGRKALSDLFDYIKKFVSADNCELIAIWIGDEEKDLKYKDIIKIGEFNWKDKFHLLEGQKIMVYK